MSEQRTSGRSVAIPAVQVTYAQSGATSQTNAMGMRPMQERAYAKRAHQYLLIKSPPASGKSRALMFIASGATLRSQPSRRIAA